VRETVAIKCILKRKLNKISTENLLTEIELMKLLRHDHIVQLKDFEWDKNYIYIIMEYCSGGDLLSFLRLKRALSEQTVRRFLQQIGMLTIHCFIGRYTTSALLYKIKPFSYPVDTGAT